MLRWILLEALSDYLHGLFQSDGSNMSRTSEVDAVDYQVMPLMLTGKA